MKLPPDIQFHEDIRLLVYRPRGLLNEATVNKIIKVIGELEAKLKEPFSRFFDTLGHDEVELNFRYVIHVSLYRRLTYVKWPPIRSRTVFLHLAAPLRAHDLYLRDYGRAKRILGECDSRR